MPRAIFFAERMPFNAFSLIHVIRRAVRNLTMAKTTRRSRTNATVTDSISSTVTSCYAVGVFREFASVAEVRVVTASRNQPRS